MTRAGFYLGGSVDLQPARIAHSRLQAPHIVPRWVGLFIRYAPPLYYRITIQ